uniref:Transthyretin-like family protein n=1 Tax=Elaeophora elaphi TaxID=1147741 RepID=A0A0R3RYS4_9BILA
MKTVLFLFLTILGISIGMRLQAVRAKGQLKCGDRPAARVKVKLWDEDDGPDPDDVLDEDETDRNGNFDLEGSTREMTTIDPVLKIYHDCDDGIKPGKRKIKLRIPGQYISSGSTAKKVFDIGVLNLETIFPKEERFFARLNIFKMHFWFIFGVLSIASFAMAMRQQAVAIKGKLLCGSAPARNVRVKLWEEDSGPDPDDLLSQGYTDEQGMFNLQGDTAELTTIDPVFKVYHDCDDNLKVLGLRKLKFKIPSSYISEGKTAKKVFDIGVLNLETIFPV